MPRGRGRGPFPSFPWLPVLGAAAGAILLALLVWFLIARPDRPAVRVAEATASAPGASTHGGSLLDASGYVIARRAATVSAAPARRAR